MSLKEKYNIVSTMINCDKSIKSLKEIAAKTREILEQTKEGIRQRKGEIAIQYEVAYKNNESLHSAFEGGKEIKREQLENTAIVTMQDAEGGEHKFYFSRDLGSIFVKGTPKDMDGELYCRITRKKL